MTKSRVEFKPGDRVRVTGAKGLVQRQFNGVTGTVVEPRDKKHVAVKLDVVALGRNLFVLKRKDLELVDG